MWLIYSVIHVFLLALVNYTDEHLATNNKLPSNSNIHTKVGSVLLISTLMSFVGAMLIVLVLRNIELTPSAKNLAMFSAIPMVVMYASYFYLLQTYPVHQIAPLFQLSSVWLLIIEIIFGGTITPTGILGIVILMYGAYVLDAGTFKWKIPTKLLMIMIPATSTWAIALYMVKVASQSNNSVPAITFWQMVTIGFIGIILFLTAKTYRDGFIFRIKNQGKKFLGFSLANETFAETAYMFSNLAVAVAPVAAYVTAMSGLQSLFVLILFVILPHGKRTKITRLQWIAVVFITMGVILIES